MNLRFVVLDEIHSYRGIFGSNVANADAAAAAHLPALRRRTPSSSVERHDRQSARAGRRADRAAGHARSTRTAARAGPSSSYFWNPPLLEAAAPEAASGAAPTSRRSELLVRLVRRGHQTICFSRTRVSSELIYRYCRDALLREAPHLAARIRAYRGGYLPEERREIERQLFSGELMARLEHERAGAGHRHRQPRRGDPRRPTPARSPAPGSRRAARGAARRRAAPSSSVTTTPSTST